MGSPDEFHAEAHPQAREITGSLQYGEWGQCIAQSKQNDRRCEGHARGPHGKCHAHGGATPTKEENEHVGAPEDNTNAIKHALFAERNKFYRKVMDNLDRQVCDDIYREMVAEYRQRNGEPTTRALNRMWQIAVEHIQISHADDWLADRPRSLESGNAMVDRETRYTEGGGQYHKYKEAVTVSTKLKLQKEHRQWLKDNNLLGDESDTTDAITHLTDLFAQLADQS